MFYKTIVMDLINDLPELQTRLKETLSLGTSIDQWAVRLSDRHHEMINAFVRQDSCVTASEVSSQAMEVAVDQIREELQQMQEETPSTPTA